MNYSPIDEEAIGFSDESRTHIWQTLALRLGGLRSGEGDFACGLLAQGVPDFRTVEILQARRCAYAPHRR